MGKMSELDIELKSSAERAELLRKQQTCAQEYLIYLLNTKGLTELFLEKDHPLAIDILLTSLRSCIRDVIFAIEEGEIK